jgi:hypothetical protein
VLSTSLDLIPFEYAVNRLGSNVSVWAMPPPIQSKMTVSADDCLPKGFMLLKRPDKGMVAPRAAIVAALVVFKNFLLSENLLMESEVKINR